MRYPKTILSTAVLIGALSSVTHAADPAARCKVGKLKESAKYASCRLKAEAKGVLAGVAPDFARCDATFDAKFRAIDTKAGPEVCPSFGDSLRIGSGVVAFSRATAAALRGVRFQDCGDGTVADIFNGLVWTKTTDSPGLTNKDARYTWTLDYQVTAPSGTAFTDFIGGLNGQAGEPCFAGHCDWRMPTKPELETILLGGCASLATKFYCIDEDVFGPVHFPGYEATFWTASTYPENPAAAWIIQVGTLDEFGIYPVSKRSAQLVRAVRAGSCPP
jgi:hypothetical protein